MPRQLLSEDQIHPAVREAVAASHRDTVDMVRSAIAQHPVVVVGMRSNPFVGRARKALNAAGVAHHDIDIGSYFAQWRRRNALKMWCGWPTFPMVFVKGQLVGGADDLNKLLASGELKRLLG
jgi:glutaredoxin-related protein